MDSVVRDDQSFIVPCNENPDSSDEDSDSDNPDSDLVDVEDNFSDTNNVANATDEEQVMLTHWIVLRSYYKSYQLCF